MSETIENPAPAPAPAPAPRGSVPSYTPPAEAQTFSREYVQELREEAKSLRLKAQAHASEAETAKQAAEKAAADAELRVTTTRTEAQNAIKMAKLEAQAVKEGLVDLDLLDKVPGIDKVTLDNGRLKVSDSFWDDARKAKPHLFGTRSTSSTAKAPEPTVDAPKTAMQMTPDEWRAYARKNNVKVT